MRKPYPSDMTDQQWAIVEPLIPVNTVGRPRVNDMREVFNAICYLNRSGCQWDMLPHDLTAGSTVFNHFSQWKGDGTWQAILDALRQQVRVAGGHDPNPSVAGIDSQTVKATEVADCRGYDGARRSPGGSGISSWTSWVRCWSSWCPWRRPTTSPSPRRCWAG